MPACRLGTMDAGDLVDHKDTCSLDAPPEHREWMRVWMDRMMSFAAWTQNLRIEAVDDELEEPVTWSRQREAVVTEEECKQLGERWNPDLLRVTRTYRVLPGPRGACPLPDDLPPRFA